MESYLKKIKLFEGLNKDELNYISKKSIYIQYDPGVIIINEGDFADSLYVIAEGSVQVFTVDKNKNTIILARLDEGKYFGEQAYLNNCIRRASVKSLTAVKLIKVNYNILDSIFNKSNKIRKYLEKTSLEQAVSNLQKQMESIDECVKDILSKSSFLFSMKKAEIKSFKKNEIIFQKGDIADYVYILTDGAIILIFNENESIIINKNHIFGEKGVLENQPRAATAKAFNQCTVIQITKNNFIKAIEKSAKMKSLSVAFKSFYLLPKSRAIIEQFVGKFENEDAIYSRYSFSSGKKIECIKVVNQALFLMHVLNIEADETLIFKKGNIERKILLKENIITGIVSVGEWDEINFLCEMLMEGVKIQEKCKESLKISGNMLLVSSNSVRYDDEIICNCMVVNYKTIKDKANQGRMNIEQISTETGAGTACGSCRIKILDILGCSDWLAAHIIFNQQLNHDTYSFIIKPIYNKLFSFIAGQYITIKLQIEGLWLERSYTLTSLSNSLESYEIIVKKYDSGKFTPWIFQNGKSPLFIWISKPSGKFFFRNDSLKPVLCLAGGIGITPFVSFVRDIKIKNFKNQFYVLHSIKSTLDLITMPDDIVNYFNQFENLHLDIWNVEKNGILNKNNLEKIINKIKPEFIYICGPEGFKNNLISNLTDLNIKNDQVLIEEFLPAG